MNRIYRPMKKNGCMGAFNILPIALKTNHYKFVEFSVS